jgi:hypothetical protein
VIFRNCAAYFQATVALQTAADAEATATTAVEQLRQEEAEANRLAQTDADRAEQARQAVAVANAKLVQARDELARFGTVEEAICKRCRQPIGPEHLERERADLERAAGEAEAEVQRLQAISDAATAAADNARQCLEQRQTQRLQTETAREEARRGRRNAETAASTARTAFEAARDVLPPAFAVRIGDIVTQGFPAEADVAAARALGQELLARIRRQEELRNQQRDRQATIETIATLQQAVNAVGAPANPAEAQARLAQLDQHLADLNRERDETTRLRDDAEAAEQNLRDPLRIAAEAETRLAGQVGGAEANARTAEQAYNDAVQGLPAGALTWDANALADELRRLEATDCERGFEDLSEDRTLQAERERQLAEAERQIEERVPPDARRPSAEVEPEVMAAEQAVGAAQDACNAARTEWEQLTRDREHWNDIQRRLQDAECDHSLHDRLAGLLGPQGIQLHLLRRTERRIIDLANEILGQVSRGELRFEPPNLTATTAFDLTVRRRGCPEPIPVGNLSPGQRCRVAIALALAVCRCACGEAQPLQSVVIDEAFANLDRDGRMAMIELLRDGQIAGGILRRIILVSHHEDVAAAFPVAYRLDNNNGTPTVTRFPQAN